jgi:mono/diheme cytochrome c family protein
MSLTRTRIVALLVLLAMTTLSAGQTGARWPPGLQKVGEASPPRTPEEEMKTFFLPPGYRVELVASEPLVQDPILIDWDADGRLWVIEMPGYMPEINPAADRERQPTGRIVVLDDTNQDGAMDRRTVFLDGLVLPRALKVLDRGVLIAEPPNLWLVADANRDLVPEGKTLVTDTYGSLQANPEHNANGLTWGLDNWIHTAEHDRMMRLKNGTFEVHQTTSRGQWGVTQDDAGRMYRNSNPSMLHVDLVPAQAFMRHPSLVRTRGSYETLADASDQLNTVWPVRTNIGVNRGYQTGVLRPDGTLSEVTAACAPTVYRGDRLPAELAGNVFVADPSGNLVSRIVLYEDEGTLRGRKAYENAEFLAATDERFRPVYLSSGPDGTLYVVDIYRGIIQHRNYITEYLRDHIVGHNLEQPTARGRIFRVVHETTRRGPRPALSGATAAELVETLAHPNGWWRDTAQRLLVERGERSEPVLAALRNRATSAPDVRTRLHALWTLDGLDRLDPAIVARALADTARDVRASAVRLAERWLGEAGHSIHAAVLKLQDDPDWAVRRQLAASLGELPAGTREPALAALLMRHGGDPVVVDAAISGLRGAEWTTAEILLKTSTQTPAVEAAATMLAATAVRGAQDGPIQALLQFVADDQRPSWQRSAVLLGAEVALVGASPLPQPAGRGGQRGAAAAAEPCPTCPGGRAGPGGASAFGGGGGGRAGAGRGAAADAGGRGRAAGAARGGAARGGGRGGRGGGGGTVVRLTREPALAAFAAGRSDGFGQRAAAVLARMEWPGKPGMAAAVTPLTAEEQQLFTAGREVYRNLCQACHQADGRGQANLGAPLIESPFALGTASVAIRILLQGKEGPTGLMPPLGGTLSDEQVAAALTYVRREWGHTASAVTPAAVAAERKATTSRTRPWTEAELQ